VFFRARPNAILCCVLFVGEVLRISLIAQTLPQTESASIPAALPASTIQVRDGTLVRVRILSTVSSRDAKSGDEIRFSVAHDVMVGDLIVIRRGASGVGHVASVQKKRRMGYGGTIAIAIDSVETITGEMLSLRAQATRNGKDAGPAMYPTALAAVDYVGTLGLGVPIMLLVKGDDVDVPAYTTFAAYVNGDTMLNNARVRSVQPAPNATTAWATIYVLRSEKRGDKSPTVYCGTLEIGQLRYQHYFEIQIPPGEYVFQSPGFKRPLQVKTETGQVYYIHFFPRALLYGGYMELADPLAADDLLAFPGWHADEKVDLSKADPAKLLDTSPLPKPPEPGVQNN